MDAIKMVEVTRSDFIEGIHYGAAVLINSDEKNINEKKQVIYQRT